MNTKFDLAWSPETGVFGFPRHANRFFEALANENRTYAPEIDVEETETHFYVNLDVPGLSKKEIKIELKEDNLIISGEKLAAKREEEKSYHVGERRFGRFERVVQLSAHVDSDKVTAVCQDGVLKITLPKSQASLAKVIEIKSDDLN